MGRDVRIKHLSPVDKKRSRHLARIPHGLSLAEPLPSGLRGRHDRTQAKELTQTSPGQLKSVVQALARIAAPVLVQPTKGGEELHRLLFSAHVHKNGSDSLRLKLRFRLHNPGDRPTTEESAKVPEKHQQHRLPTAQLREGFSALHGG